MSERGHNHQVLDDLRPQHRELRQMIPGVYQAFNDLSGAAMAAGALDTKVKELMAM
ncbi:MAG TPA: carboxymuconolactone decarboxylase family protein, partial [Mycobacterium sp.]|nr:carboxymuconolactone decarboxylase family protein [Mycobacterium sp.]